MCSIFSTHGRFCLSWIFDHYQFLSLRANYASVIQAGNLYYLRHYSPLSSHTSHNDWPHSWAHTLVLTDLILRPIHWYWLTSFPDPYTGTDWPHSQAHTLVLTDLIPRPIHWYWLSLFLCRSLHQKEKSWQKVIMAKSAGLTALALFICYCLFFTSTTAIFMGLDSDQ